MSQQHDGERFGHSKTQQGMSSAQGVEVSIPPIEFAEEQPTQQRCRNQPRIGNMRRRKQQSRAEQRKPAAPERSLKAFVEGDLQEKLLDQRPCCVQIRIPQRRPPGMAGIPCPGYPASKENKAGQNRWRRQGPQCAFYRRDV